MSKTVYSVLDAKNVSIDDILCHATALTVGEYSEVLYLCVCRSRVVCGSDTGCREFDIGHASDCFNGRSSNNELITEWVEVAVNKYSVATLKPMLSQVCPCDVEGCGGCVCRTKDRLTCRNAKKLRHLVASRIHDSTGVKRSSFGFAGTEYGWHDLSSYSSHEGSS